MTPTPTLTADTFPSFAPQLPAEGWSDYGVRAARYILTHGTVASFKLDARALDAAADVLCGPLLVARDVAPRTLVNYTETQRTCRLLAKTRRAELAGRLAALVALGAEVAPEAQPVAVVAPAGPVAPAAGGSGGSRVPVAPKRPQGPRGGARVSADESGQQGSWRAIAPLQLQADDAF